MACVQLLLETLQIHVCCLFIIWWRGITALRACVSPSPELMQGVFSLPSHTNHPHSQKHVDNVLRWVEGLPPPPMRRSTPDLVGNVSPSLELRLPSWQANAMLQDTV
eukprot:1143559-Pelagomonas_calceolata.AAC.3